VFLNNPDHLPVRPVSNPVWQPMESLTPL